MPCSKFLAAFLCAPAAWAAGVCATVTADQAGAIQQQLDACAGGTVELSAAKGSSFTSGPLYLPSNVVLVLDAGVVLNASTNPADFQRAPTSRTQACNGSGPIPVCGSLDPNNTGCVALVNACKVTNSGVAGAGTIEGNGWSPLTGGANAGTSWWALADAAKAGNYANSLNAPKMIDFQQSTNVSVTGIAIHNAPLVHMLFGKDTGVTVSQVTIVTPTPAHTTANFPYNSDGMDASGSTNVTVDRVDFTDGDDNIALEGGGNGPVRNVTVTNSTFRAGHGLSIGSPTSSGVTDVTANNITFIGTDNGLRIKSDMSAGGVVDRIRYSNVCMKGVKDPIVIDPNYSTTAGTLLPIFKAVELDNVYADAGALTLKAFAGQPPLQLTLNNVRIDKVNSIAAGNANITQIVDPAFPFPIAIPAVAGVSVTAAQAAAAAPEDIKTYCQTAFTLSQAAGPANIVSGASYAPDFAADSIVSIFANGFASGSTVNFIDASGGTHRAELFVATATQINAHVPADLPPGPAFLSVPPFWSPVTVSSIAPGIFSADASGSGVAAAQLITNHADGTQTTQTSFPTPLDLGAPTDTSALVLYATGVRNAPAVTVTIGGIALQPFYLGPAPGFVGLDQVNTILPHNLAGRQNVNVTITAGPAVSNTVTLSFK